MALKSIARAEESGLFGARADDRYSCRWASPSDKRNGAETLIGGTWAQKIPYTR